MPLSRRRRFAVIESGHLTVCRALSGPRIQTANSKDELATNWRFATRGNDEWNRRDFFGAAGLGGAAGRAHRAGPRIETSSGRAAHQHVYLFWGSAVHCVVGRAGG